MAVEITQNFNKENQNENLIMSEKGKCLEKVMLSNLIKNGFDEFCEQYNLREYKHEKISPIHKKEIIIGFLINLKETDVNKIEYLIQEIISNENIKEGIINFKKEEKINFKKIINSGGETLQ